MSADQPSWREVADRLAERMVAMATTDYLLDDSPGCAHGSLYIKSGACPFCADRAAYQAYLAKRGVSR